MQSGIELTTRTTKKITLPNQQKLLALAIVSLDTALEITAQLMAAYPELKKHGLIEEAYQIQLAAHLKKTMAFYPETYIFKKEAFSLRKKNIDARGVMSWVQRMSIAVEIVEVAIEFNISEESIQIETTKLIAVLKILGLHLDSFRPTLEDRLTLPSMTKGYFTKTTFNAVKSLNNVEAQKLFIDCCSHLHFFSSVKFRVQNYLSSHKNTV